LTVLTAIGAYRLYNGPISGFDSYLLIFWFILVLFPIISEVSIFGVNLKKDIESAKNELKSYIGEIKNQINYSPIINLNTVPAERKEYEGKVREDIKEDTKPDKREKVFALSPSEEVKTTGGSEKSQERFNKVLAIEKLVTDYFMGIYGENYKSQMKIEDELSGKKVIADGLIFKNGKIDRIIEIKYITSRSFDHIFYVVNRHIGKIFKLGLRVPVRFVIISENLDYENAKIMISQMGQLNFARASSGLPRVEVDFFKFDGSKLLKITTQTHKSKKHQNTK